MIDTLRLRHLVATSPLAGPAETVRGLSHHWRNLFSPELGLLRQESAMMEALLGARLSPDSCCLDVGAHVGSMSRHFERLAPRGRHILVEASPRKAAWLARRFPDMTVHNVAVGDRAGEVSFFENLANPGYSSITDRTGRGKTREIRVTSARLDDLLPEGARVDFVKIDVEGHELEALRGGARFLRRFAPTILFEAGAIVDADFADDGTELFNYLTGEFDYRIHPVYGLHHRQPPIDLDLFLRCRSYPFLAFNFVALPP